MTSAADEKTLARVVEIVGEIIQDWGLDLDAPLSAGTMLAADLEFASVDIIQLCVALENSYGCRFGFQDLLMKDGSYVGDLALGEFATFIDARLAEGVAS